jgi:hypothetical protein
MSNIITVPKINDAVMNADRARLSQWAPSNGWVYTPYNDAADHVAQISAAAGWKRDRHP